MQDKLIEAAQHVVDEMERGYPILGPVCRLKEALATVRAHDAGKVSTAQNVVDAGEFFVTENRLKEVLASSHAAESAPPTVKPSSKPFYANAECGRCGASLYEGCEWIDAGGKTPAKMAVCGKCFQQQPRSQIRTSFINPPIPIRGFDWVAWIDGEEEGHRGHGCTEQEAKDELGNLLAQFDAESAALVDRRTK